jgi:hypothetical protein
MRPDEKPLVSVSILQVEALYKSTLNAHKSALSERTVAASDFTAAENGLYGGVAGL